MTNFGYEGDLLLPVEVRPPANLGAAPFGFSTQAQWLMCKDVCIPGEAALSLTLGAAGNGPSKPGAWISLFESMAARTPNAQLMLEGDLLSAGDQTELLLTAEALKFTAKHEFYPYAEGLIRNSAPQKLAQGTLGARAATTLSVPLDGGVDRVKLNAAGFFNAPAGVLIQDSKAYEVNIRQAGFAADWKPESVKVQGANDLAANASNSLSLTLAMSFAVLGGLILNLMPCVFPVVGLKVLGFVDTTTGVPAKLAASQRAGCMRKALAFCAGVVVSFWVLALVLLLFRSTGQALGWGFQLQSPGFVMIMALLFMLIGLNLSGLFEFGLTLTRLGDTGQARNSALLNFGSGALAVVVATPCTAPFMGSALGYTLAQPALQTLAVFTAMAVGMCIPYLLLGAFPGWLKWLPKPGRWMESLRQFLAFPMYAATVWLVWVLAQQAGVDAVLSFGVAAISLGLAAWIYGRFVQAAGRMNGFAFSALAAFLMLAIWSAMQISEDLAPLANGAGPPSAGGTSNPAESTGRTEGESAAAELTGHQVWGVWSNQAVNQALAAGRPVFVDFTASWCVSCQVNKKLVLDRAAVVAAMKQHQVIQLRADWTQRNPQISQALAQFGRNGVPLYVLYDPSEKQPKLLPELLTQAIVLDALAGLSSKKLSLK